jgi:hypothetical protein
MSRWTSAGPYYEDLVDAAGEPMATAAATDGAATTCAEGATKDEAEPPVAAADTPAPSRAGVSLDEEEPEATAAPDSPTLPCPAIHSSGPDDTTLVPHRNHQERDKAECGSR